MSYKAVLDEAWQQHLAPKESGAPTIISLFAGCGGSSLGYSMAGFKELLAVEWNDNAIETFKLNFPDIPIYHGDIHKLTVERCLEMTDLQSGELDLLDGSPPCQGFSTAGKRRLKDERNQLYMEFVRLLRGLQPKVFVMENVSGLVKGKMKLVFADIMRELKASGYKVKCRLMNAMYFQVPQSRQRLIWIGVKDDLHLEPNYPKAECKPITCRNVLPNQPMGIDLPTRYKKVWMMTKPGESFGDGNKRLIGKQTSFAAKKLDPNRPSNAVTKQIRLGLSGLHRWDAPCLVSGLGLRRLGSFPDCFRFPVVNEEQLRDYRIIAHNIGNSVPPLFMRAIARHIRTEILDNFV